jgi:NCAIR mutase (PurE)-related protein
VDEAALRELVEGITSGAVDADEAVSRLRRLPFADLGFARVDHHRQLRTNLPEAVYAPGKTPEHCVAVIGELLATPGGPVILTRADPTQAGATLAAHPGGVATAHDPCLIAWRLADPRAELVVVVSAGTADLPVADECAATLTALGYPPRRLTDVGVAGVHRLLVDIDTLAAARAIVVVAGMEGALASVVGGLASAPIVAVPTSVGYGSALEGVTALLAVMSSCAAGITVVGIDNGFGAACAVARTLGGSEATHG